MYNRLGRGVVVFVLVFLCRIAVAAPPADVPPAVSFDGAAVVVSAIVPGETAILYGIAHDPEPYGITTRNIIYAETAGPDGRARFAFDGPLPPHTVLAAIDASTGRYAIASPGNPAPPVHALPADAFKKRQDPEYELLDLTTTSASGPARVPGTSSPPTERCSISTGGATGACSSRAARCSACSVPTNRRKSSSGTT
jgi:hypothetical protein